MGRRKSRAIPHKVAQDKVPKTFDCPFCNHEKTVFCQMDRRAKIALLRCRMCGSKYQAEIHRLTEPIDVYGDWLDECERTNREITDVGTVTPFDSRFADEDGGMDMEAPGVRRGGVIDDGDDGDLQFGFGGGGGTVADAPEGGERRRSTRLRRGGGVVGDDDEAADEALLTEDLLMGGTIDD